MNYPEKKTFFVDFSGYCEIEATSEEEADKIFWEFVNSDKSLPQNIYEIENIEEKE